jgi:hypothetical protein
MGRIARGVSLVRASLTLLRHDPGLLWLPIASVVSILIFAGLIFWPALVVGLSNTSKVEIYVLLAVLYFAASFITIFFNAAMIAAASDRLSGGPGSIRAGVGVAWSHAGPLLAWALLSATVGVIVRVVESRMGLAAIFARLLGAAWTVMTFFVVPVLVFEGVGPIEAMKRSGGLFRQRWGEQLVGNGSIGILLFIAFGICTFVAFVLGTVLLPLGIVFAVLAFALLVSVGSAVTAIFNAALYRYAVSGGVTAPFKDDDFSGAFRQRGAR